MITRLGGDAGQRASQRAIVFPLPGSGYCQLPGSAKKTSSEGAGAGFAPILCRHGMSASLMYSWAAARCCAFQTDG